jgi:hypothetical protein
MAACITAVLFISLDVQYENEQRQKLDDKAKGEG